MKTTLLSISKMSLLLFLGLGTILISCSGEDGKDGINGEMGVQGQEGPQGEPGTQGEQGPQGEPGQDGKDGNSNVIVSDWMEITWDEIDNMVPPTWGNMFIEEIPNIDDINAFMEAGGVVLFYVRLDFGSSNTIILLPFHFEADHLYAWTIVSEDPNDGMTGFVVRGESTNVTFMENNSEFMIRYVLVPANVVQTTGMADNMPETFDEAVSLLGL